MRFSGKRWLAGLLAAVLLQQQLVPATLAEELSSGEAAVYTEDTAYPLMSSEDLLEGGDLYDEELLNDEEDLPDQDDLTEEDLTEEDLLSDGVSEPENEEYQEFDPDAEDTDAESPDGEEETGEPQDGEEFPEDGTEEEELESEDDDLLLSSAPLVGAAQGSVPYIDENGEPATAASCTLVQQDVTAWKNGWYVVEGEITIDARVTVTKDVSLILADGAKLHIPLGITVNGTSTNALHIYAQEEGTGVLTAGDNCAKNNAGIGGKSGMLSGPISIHGGTVTGKGGLRGAGIGGGLYSDASYVTITGGNVTAIGGEQAAGIGGGYQGGCQNLSISGGVITAIAGKSTSGAAKNAEAIGTGQDPTAGSGELNFALYDGAEIRAGTDENNVEIYFSDSDGVTACRNNPYVHISQATEGIHYVDKEGTEWLLSSNLYTRVTADTTTLEHGWYAVTGEVTFNNRVQVSGKVNLILADGASMTATYGITVPEGSSLIILGQKNQEGRLKADANLVNGNAGIGAENGGSAGNIEIYGGKVTAVGGLRAAAVGAAGDGGATVTIGGFSEVNATGGRDGAGIGGGPGTSITIEKGTVTANGTVGGAGIGGNNGQSAGTIRIMKGTVTATGGESGAGIGGGRNGDGGTIEIRGGTVHASAPTSGAGIGGGSGGNGAVITIIDGDVTAEGGSAGGAGIGGGSSGSGGSMDITGGKVLAIGRGSSMAIGGDSADTGSITFGNMKVFAGNSAESLSPVQVGPDNDIREQECRKPCAEILSCEGHEAADGYLYNEEGHWNVCRHCMMPMYEAEHKYKEYAPKNKTENYPFDPVDETLHQRECEICGYFEKGVHEYDTGDIHCQLCGGGEIIVTYVDAAGNKKQHKGCRQVLGASDENEEVTELNDEVFDGFYVVKGDVTIEHRMEVYGKVNLVLSDGATLNAREGITVSTSDSLTIWCQEKGTGKLTAKGTDGYAGIGGEPCDNGGTIVINGGVINATGDFGGAGIGSGSYHDDPPTQKYIGKNGDYVNITSGIGPKVTINGGNVTAKGEYFSAGIGGGLYCSGGTINITGGTVLARGDGRGAGIGGGNKGAGGTINITGGDVTAIPVGVSVHDNFQENWAAAIGSGDEGAYAASTRNYTNITITSGARVDARGYGATAIGLGHVGRPQWVDCVVNIEGGQIKASSAAYLPIGVSESPHIWKGNYDDIIKTDQPSYVNAPKTIVYISRSGRDDYLDLNGPTDDWWYDQASDFKERGGKYGSEYRDLYVRIILKKAFRDKRTNRGYADYTQRDVYADKYGCMHSWELGRTTLTGPYVYYIHFDGNGASGSMEDDASWAFDGYQPYSMPDSGFITPYGKYFMGWKIENEGDLYRPGYVYTTRMAEGGQTVTLYAQWGDGYGVWVGNKLVTPENKDDVLGDGTVSYDPDSKTLHLDHLTKIPIYSNPHEQKPLQNALIYTDHELTVEVNETCINADELPDYGIYSTADLVIKSASGSASGEVERTLEIFGQKEGIHTERFLTIQDLANLSVRSKSTDGYGIYTDKAVIFKRDTLPPSTLMRYEITGGTAIQSGRVAISDIQLVRAEATNPENTAISVPDGGIEIRRNSCYTRLEAVGGSIGIYSDNMINTTDADISASGTSYGIYSGRGLWPTRKETVSRITAESEGTGIYVAGYLRNTEGIVKSTGGKIGIETTYGIVEIWNDYTYADIRTEAHGETQAVVGPVDIGFDLAVNRPENATLRSDNTIADENGEDPKDVLISPRELTLTFDPGEGSGTMPELTVIRGEEVALPRCTFTSPASVIPFGGWAINGKSYAEGDVITLTDDSTATARWGFTWVTLQNLMKKGGTIVLPNDVTAEAADTFLTSDKDVTIDLNGHTIDRNCQKSVKDGQVFRVDSGTLTIKDTTGGGTITGGKTIGNGGAVYLSGGEFVLENGTITGNEAVSAESGQVYGGAVYVDHGTFTMSGGEISGNKAPTAGSAVFIANSDARFVMTGGTITKNDSTSGCAVLPMDGRFEISGSPVITGNLRQGKASWITDYNLYYLSSYARKTVPIQVTGPLDEEACIHVGTSRIEYPVITSGLPGNGSRTNFVSNDPNYTVFLNEDGEAVLMAKKTLTFYADPAGKEVLLTEKLFPGELLAPFLDQLDAEKEGYTFAGWTQQKSEGSSYNYKAAVPGSDEYCLEDVSAMEMPASDLSFYPVLIRDRVQVHLDPGAFDKNQSTTNLNGWTTPPVYTDTETPANLAASQYRCFNIELGETIRMNEGMSAITRPGYDLDAWLTQNGTRWNSGWGADPQYCDTDSSGNPVIKKSDEYPYSYYTMTLKAAWTLKKATVRYSIGAGKGMFAITTTVAPGGKVTVNSAKPLPPNDEMVFVGWKDAQGNILSGGDSFVYDSLDRVSTLAEGSGNNTIRLTAVYVKIPQGALIFDSQGGTTVDPIQKKPTDGSTSYQVTESEVSSKKPVRTGYSFTGWYTSPDCKTKVTFPVTITGDDNVTVYAGWEPKEYTITLEYGGDAGVSYYKGLYGEPVNIPDPEREHYRFDGWSPAMPVTMPAGNMTVTARWIPLYYTITLDLAGGSGVSYISAIYGASITAPEDPVREGYVFAGWEPALPAFMPDTNPTIKARWKQLQDKPDAPVVTAFTDTTIEVAAEEGQEYAIKRSGTPGSSADQNYEWQKPDETGRMIFTDLLPVSEYRIVTRKAGSDDKVASPVSDPTDARTDKTTQEKPEPPVLTSALTSVEVVSPVKGQEYAIRPVGTSGSGSSLDWQKPDEDNGRMLFDGLTPDTSYQVVTRMAETDSAYASEISDPATIYTEKVLVESARITGTLRYGETLTAAVQPSDAEDLTCRWFRKSTGGEPEEIEGANGRTYVLKEEDIGKTLTVEVLQTVQGGDDVTVTADAGPVRKGVSPAAPVVSAEAEETTLEVTSPVQENDRYEYSLDNKTWRSSTLFAGLTPGTAYTVYAREKETATHEAGQSASVRITTKLTTADVYEIRQNADGSWPEEPGEPLKEKAVARYQVPQDPSSYTAAGYRFDTYAGTDTGSTACGAGSSIVLVPETKSLYIYYTRNTYDLVFHADIAGTRVSTTYQVRHGASLADYAEETVQAEGYTFAGWTEAPKTDGAYEWKQGAAGQKESVLADLTVMTMPTAGKNLYPVLIPHRLQVHLDVGAVDKNADETNMNGWTNPVTYTDTATAAEMNADQYRSFTTNPGEKLRMDEGMNATTRPGYVLDGWYTKGGVRWTADMGTDPEYCDKDEAGNPLLAEHPDRPYSYYTITLTARWAIRWADVVYDVAGGSGTVTGDTPVIPYGRVVVTDQTPEAPKGYGFIGWKDKAGHLYKAGQSFGYYNLNNVTALGTGDGNNTITLTAQYAEIPQGSLLFDTQGGTMVDPIHKDAAPGSGSYQIAETEAADRTTTREGYTFTGWYTDPACKTAVTWPVTITGNTDTTVYAGWKANEYTITFDSKGGTAIPDAVYDFDTAVAAPSPAPEKLHYTFGGWKPVLPERMPAHDLHVEAVWTPVTYTITFDTAGGSAIDPIKGIYGSRVTSPADPVREGYTFTGWETEIPAYMPDTNPTITATWKQNQEAPAAPVVKSVTDTTIEVVAEPDQEYAIALAPKGRAADSDSTSEAADDHDWQKPGTDGRMIFTGLSPATTYRIVTRKAMSATKMPSDPSAPTDQATDKSAQEAPEAPELVPEKTSIEVFPTEKGLEYSIDSGKTWQKPDADGQVVFDGLTEDTGYSVIARRAETKTQHASEASPEARTYTKKTLLDMVRISGTPKNRETLTAEITPADAADVTCQWYREDGSEGPGTPVNGATTPSYTLTEADIGRRISVRAVQTVKGGDDVTVQDTLAQPVRKADGNPAPEVQAEPGETEVTVTTPKGDPYEYSLDGTTWQDAPLFEGLTPGTDYRVLAREKETAGRYAGVPGMTKVTTLVTTAEVFEVLENVDGTFTEPSSPMAAKAAGSYMVPDKARYTAAGYRFDTFSADISDAENTKEGDEIVLVPGTKKLYVYYRRNVHNLTFYEDIAGKKVKIEYDVRTGMPLSGYANETVTLDGYTFAGWTDEPKSDGAYDWREGTEGTDESVLVDVGSYTMPDGNLAFYPVLIGDRLQVHLDVGAVDRNANETNMNGWTNPASASYTDTETAAEMDADQYRSFTTNAGEKLRMDEGMDSVSRPGYVLDGWYTDAGVRWSADMGTDPEYCDKDTDGNAILTKHPDRPYSYYTITLTARWALRWADVVYDVAGGSGSVTHESAVVPYGRVTITDQEPVAPEGCQFIGWKDKNGYLYKAGQSFAYNNLKKVTALGIGGANNTITLTAQYFEIPKGSLVFDSQGGSWVEPIHKIADPGAIGYTVSKDEIDNHQKPEREGYTFTRWYHDADCQMPVTGAVIIIGDANETLYAGWQVNSFKISYDSKGGTKIEDQVVPYDSAVAAPSPAPEKLHYDFGGWQPALPERMPAHDLLEEAVWTPATYTITFETAGGNAIDPIEGIYGSRVTSPADPVREGYTFTGWNKEIPAYMPDTNPTITATWKQNQEAPAAPVVKSVTDTTIEVEAEPDQEYAIAAAPEDSTSAPEDEHDWQKPDADGRMLFSGLSPAVTYRIVTRKPGSETKMPSDASAPTDQATDKSAQEAPSAPQLVPENTSIEVFPTEKGLEYSIDNGKTWQKPDADGQVVFEGLTEDTEYSVIARRAETKTKHASEASPATKVYTKKTLLDMVRISGTPKNGETLTAEITPADAADVTYQWYRANGAEEDPGTPITGATGTTYTLTESDIGKLISVRAVQTVKGGDDVTVMDTLAQPVRKAHGNPAPVVQAEPGETEVTVTAPKGDTYEYSLDNKTWQDEPLFEGLTPGTRYSVYAREKETAGRNAGVPGMTRVTTLVPTAEVYEVLENVDGTFTEPSSPMAARAAGSYMVPDKARYTAAGYRFDTFSADIADAENAKEGDEIVLPAGTGKLYVYYRRNVHNLTFYEDIAGKKVKIEYDVRTGTPLFGYANETVTPDGCTFAGWTDEPKSDGAYDWREGTAGTDESVLVDVGSYTMPDGNLAFYPVLIGDRLQVHLDVGAVDKNADETNMNGWTNPVTYTDDATAAEMDADQYRSFTTNAGEALRMDEGMDSVTRPGYVLDGWYTGSGVKWSADMGTDPEYCDKDADGNPILTKHPDRPYSYYTITLTASWELRWADVVYDVAGGSGSVTHESAVIPYGRVIITDQEPEAPEGCAFIGWKDKNGYLYKAGQSFGYYNLNNVTKIGTGDANNTITLTAQYLPLRSGTLILDSQGGLMVDPIQKTSAPGGPAAEVTEEEVKERVTTREGYTFAGWVTTPGGSTPVTYPISLAEGIVTIYASWTPVTCTITFDSRGGSEVEPVEYAYGEEIDPFPVPTRDHYDFVGWTPAYTQHMTMPAHDLTVEAGWTPRKYTITFDTAGGSDVAPIEDIYGARVTAPADPTREDYVFMGWDPEIPAFMPDTNPTIKAVWKKEQAVPASPVVIDVTDTQIQVKQEPGQEYAIRRADAPSDDAAWSWQRFGLFTGLSPATEYAIVTRRAETEELLPSGISKPARQKTDKSDQAAPAAPGTMPGRTSIEVTPVTPGQVYAIEPADEPETDDSRRTWVEPDEDGKVIFDGLTEDTPYRVVARWTETDYQKASPASAPSEVYTLKNLLTDASLTGTPKYQETLTVSIEPEDAPDVTCSWYRRDPADGEPGANELPGERLKDETGTTLTLTAADIGKDIYVRVVQNVRGGGNVVRTLHAGPVDKLDGPAAPTVQAEAAQTTINITAPKGDTYEYSLDGKTWQTEPSFTGLTPGQTYTVHARNKETDVQKAGKTGTTSVRTPDVVADVWEVFQQTDGSWVLPDKPAHEDVSGAWTLPSDPEGFAADGYSRDAFVTGAESRKAAAAGETVTFPAGTKDLYIYYTRRSFTLSFCSDIEGENVQSSRQVLYGASLAPYAGEKTSMEGYTFDGWSETPKTDGPYRWKAADPDSKKYVVADLASMTMPASDKTFYPILVGHRVVVHLDPGAVDAYADETNMNGWENPVKYRDADTKAYLAASQYRSFITDEGEKVRMNEGMDSVTRDGYVLQGWYTSDGIRWEAEMGTSFSYSDRDRYGNAVLAEHESSLYSFYTMTLTARWSPKEITVSYDEAAPDGHTALGEILTLPASADSPEGKRLSGWMDRKEIVHAPGEDFLFEDWELTEKEVLAFTPVYEDIPEYGVIFDTDGGSYIETVTVPEGSSCEQPQDPERTGWIFAGWYLGEEKVSFPITDIRSTITVKARWTKRAYTIIFDTKGGNAMAPMTLEYGAKVTVPDPVREGYSFGGWSPALPATMPAYDLPVEASWSPMIYYIYFDTDGGTEIPPIKAFFGEKVTAPADPEKEGYTFAGWDREIPAYMPSTNPTFKAKWTPNEYTITFDTDGGNTIEPATYKYQDAVTAPEDPEKEGYTFNGWSPELPETMPAKDLTVKAQWTEISPTPTSAPEDITPTPSGEPTPTGEPGEVTPIPSGGPAPSGEPTPTGAPDDVTPTPSGAPGDVTPTPTAEPGEVTPTPSGEPMPTGEPGDVTPTPTGEPEDITPTPAGAYIGSWTTNGSLPSMDVENVTGELAEKMASDAEKARVEKGEDFYLTLVITNIDNTIPSSEKKRLKNALEAEADNAKASLYMDLSVFTRIGDDSEQQVTDLNGNMVKVKLTIPDNLKAKSGVDRTYYIARLHDGKAKILAESSGNSITFETDKFSSYALGYSDDTDDSDSSTNRRNSDDTDVDDDDAADHTSEEGTKAAGTGDETQTGFWFLLMACAAIVACFAADRKRKRHI